MAPLRMFALAISLLCATGSLASAQAPEWYGRRVEQVSIEGAAAGAIELSELGVRVGEVVDRYTTRQAVARLLSSGRWRDVQVFAEPVGDAGAAITFVLVPRLTLLRVEIAGNEAMRSDELRRAIDQGPGRAVSEADLRETEQHIVEFYASRGYFSAQATASLIETDDPSARVLRVVVAEGAVTRVASIEWRGDPLPEGTETVDVMELEVGDVLERRVLEESVREAQAQLRAEGYLEAQLEQPAEGPPAESTPGAGAHIVIPTRVGRHYSVQISEPAPLDRDAVLDALQLGDERLGRGAALIAMQERVVDLYEKYGYIDARVEVRRYRLREEGEALLRVAIAPGRQLDVSDFTFPGAGHFEGDFLREQVHAYLQEDLPGSSILSPVDSDTVARIHSGRRSHERSAQRPERRDPRETYYESTIGDAVSHIEKLYQADGYLDVEVGPAALVRGEPGEARVLIPITEGTQTFLYRVELDGIDALPTPVVLEEVSLERGAPFSYLQLEEARLKMVENYQEQGYVYVDIEPSVNFSSDRTRAEIVFEIVEGPQVRVRDIIVRGADQTSESIIRDRLAFRSGDLYSPSAARESEEQLMDLGALSAVDVSPVDPDTPAQLKDVLISIVERPWGYVEYGGGVSTGQGMRGHLEFGLRNLLGLGMSFAARAQVGYLFFFVDNTVRDRFTRLDLIDQLERRVSFSIGLPHIPGVPRLRATLDVVHQRDNERDFGLDKNAIGLTFTYRPVRRLTLSLSGHLENNNVDLFVDEGYEEFLRQTANIRFRERLRVPEGESTLVALRTTAAIDQRDNPFNPTTGWFASVFLEYGRTLTSDSFLAEGERREFFSNHLKTSLRVSGYIPLGGDVVLASQIRAGHVFHFEEESRTYPNRQFFMGGVSTLRGLLQDLLIPQDLVDQILASPSLGPNDVLRGGDTFLLLRAELRFPLFGNFRGGLFADVGNLWSSVLDLGSSELLRLRFTGGIGLRYDTAVGPFAFDIGFNPFRRTSLGEPLLAAHFSIGLF